MNKHNIQQIISEAISKMESKIAQLQTQNREYNKGCIEGYQAFKDIIIEKLSENTHTTHICIDCDRHISSSHEYDEYCAPCLKAQATEGVSPNKITIER